MRLLFCQAAARPTKSLPTKWPIARDGQAARRHGKIAGLDVVKEYSYTTERSSGDGWVLVGDSWGFIDPIYSSGVWFALKTGQLAADASSKA